MVHCLILEQKTNYRVDDVHLNHLVVWIQIHGLQLDHLLLKNADKLGNLAGIVMGVDQLKLLNEVRRCFLQMKVSIDVNRPLKSKTWVNRKDSSRKLGLI